MIRNSLGGLLVACVLGLVAATPAQALLEDNLSSLSEEQTVGYLSPLVGGLSGSLNSGIFRSGHVPTTGLSLTLDVKAAYMAFSDDDRLWTTPATGGYESVDAPTVIGNTEAVTADHQTVGGLQFTYPGGFDMSNFGVAVPQLTIGNVAGTRAMVRYISLSLGDEDVGDLKFFGIGGQHSISQYLPGVPVDLAFGIMYQSLELGDGVVDASALALNVTGSKRLGTGPVSLEPYLGVGLDSFTMDAKYDSGDDEITAEFDRANDGHLTLGTGINLPGVKLHAEYSVAAVSGFAGGVSFGI
ncbi:MAG TPA: DUF6588 family protein [bacterium]|nr:DUF6588 family protein [bacterium]